ncbi:hypothetical protein DL96DRAFT_555871 [Flagelloscypha sp. PMI_526]|nr:hypothetical protein DL96DRAFT_555871 [Flagelloscypha sp. PMI_526]
MQFKAIVTFFFLSPLASLLLPFQFPLPKLMPGNPLPAATAVDADTKRLMKTTIMVSSPHPHHSTINHTRIIHPSIR